MVGIIVVVPYFDVYMELFTGSHAIHQIMSRWLSYTHTKHQTLSHWMNMWLYKL